MVKDSLKMFNIPADSWEVIARSQKEKWRKMIKDGMGVALDNWITKKRTRRGTGSERAEGGIDDVEEGSEDAVQALLYADMDGDTNEDENPGGMSDLEKLRYIFAFIDAVCEARRVINEARSMTSSEVVVEESQYDKEDGKSIGITLSQERRFVGKFIDETSEARRVLTETVSVTASKDNIESDM